MILLSVAFPSPLKCLLQSVSWMVWAKVLLWMWPSCISQVDPLLSSCCIRKDLGHEFSQN